MLRKSIKKKHLETCQASSRCLKPSALAQVPAWCGRRGGMGDRSALSIVDPHFHVSLSSTNRSHSLPRARPFTLALFTDTSLDRGGDTPVTLEVHDSVEASAKRARQPRTKPRVLFEARARILPRRLPFNKPGEVTRTDPVLSSLLLSPFPQVWDTVTTPNPNLGDLGKELPVYLMRDYDQDCQGLGVVGSVHIEATVGEGTSLFFVLSFFPNSLTGCLAHPFAHRAVRGGCRLRPCGRDSLCHAAAGREGGKERKHRALRPGKGPRLQRIMETCMRADSPSAIPSTLSVLLTRRSSSITLEEPPTHLATLLVLTLALTLT